MEKSVWFRRNGTIIFPAPENDAENWTTSLHSKESFQGSTKNLNKIKSFGIYVLSLAAVPFVTSPLRVAAHAAAQRHRKLPRQQRVSRGHVSVGEKRAGTHAKGWGEL